LAELEAAFGALHLGQLVAANFIVLAATAVQAATGIGFALIANLLWRRGLRRFGAFGG